MGSNEYCARGKRVLFYVDTLSMLDAAIEAADAIQLHLGARVVFLVVDSARYADRLTHYEVYDFGDLFRPAEDIYPLGATLRASATRDLSSVLAKRLWQYVVRGQFGAARSELRVALRYRRDLLRYHTAGIASGARTALRHQRNLFFYRAASIASRTRGSLRHRRKLAKLRVHAISPGLLARLRERRAAARIELATSLRHRRTLLQGHAVSIAARTQVALRHRRNVLLYHADPIVSRTRTSLKHRRKLAKLRIHALSPAFFARVRERRAAARRSMAKIKLRFGPRLAGMAPRRIDLSGYGASSRYGRMGMRLAGVVPGVFAVAGIIAWRRMKRRRILRGRRLAALGAIRDGIRASQLAIRRASAQIRDGRSSAKLLLRRSGHDLRARRGKLNGVLRTSALGQAGARARFLVSGSGGVRTLLNVVKPDAIVVLEDNIQTYSRFFVEEASRRGVPAMILPFTIPNPTEAAQFYKGNRAYSLDGLVKSLFVKIFPRWRHDHLGQGMMRLPLDQAVLYELFGYATSKPWVLNYGSASAIAVESEAMRTAYTRLGFQADRLKVVGEPIGKVLHQGLTERAARRSDLLAGLGLDPSKPLIVCGFPPDQYNSNDTSHFEFETFERMLDAWMSAFGALHASANVVIRPHPRLDPKALKLRAPDNVRISGDPTAQLIPLADIYVASISATIRWAIACGIPVVNYDCYRYRYDDYASADGVIAVEHLGDFRREIGRLIGEPAYFEAVRARQRAVMNYWGVADDKFAERFARMAQELLRVPPLSSPPRLDTRYAGLRHRRQDQRQRSLTHPDI